MTDLSAQLTIARDVVQTFAAALGLFSDDDLRQLPGSSSAASQRVRGTKTPPTPYNGDGGLPGHVLGALRQTHLCAIALCALDCVDDPSPLQEAPSPDRTALPSLRTIARHLEYVDRALQQVQHQVAHLDLEDIVAALQACEQVMWDRLPKGGGTQINHRRWDGYARRARKQCAWCWRTSGSAELCTVCAGDEVKCRGIADEECSRLIPRAHHRCPACRQRLSRSRAKAS